MKLLHLSIAVFTVSVAVLYMTRPEPSPVPAPNISKAEELPSPAPTPVLTSMPPTVSALGIYIYDVSQQVPLFAKNADTPLAPASTTKMMTALVASDVYNFDTVVTVPAFTVDGQKMGLYPGEKMTIESLLYGTLVDSANDAAEALSRVYPQGRSAFISLMNAKAKNLGMSHTTFLNPSGLDESGHMSSARDMTLLGEAIMNNPRLRQIVGTTSASVTSVDGKSVHHFIATNTLLSTINGVQGIKTGWTEAAHENLVTYVVRNNHPVIIALYGSDDRFGETKELIDWTFSSVKW